MFKFRAPNPAARYPVDPRALFVLILCIVAGIPLLSGVAEPGSIEQTLPSWAIIIWALGLVIGASVTLGGMSQQTLKGALLEQVGSVAVGVATIYYGAVIMYIAPGLSGLLPASIVVGWGAANIWRWFQLRAYIGQEIARHTEGGDLWTPESSS